MSKISIIGAGHVGATIAYTLAMNDCAEKIAIIDLNEALAQAEVYDIRPGFEAISRTEVYKGSYADTADSDLIIITAGLGRKPGESRLDLIAKNTKIAREIAGQIKKNASKALIMVVANPVDIITRIIAEEMGEYQGRVFGTGCSIDSSRFISVLAEHFNLTNREISAFIAGEHGAGQVSLWSSVKLCGRPLAEYLQTHNLSLSAEDKKGLDKKVADMGAAIIGGKGYTNFGIASVSAYIAGLILNKKTAVLPLTRPLNGEFGYSKICISLPCVLTENGVKESRIDSISDEEKKALINTIETLKQINI